MMLNLVDLHLGPLTTPEHMCAQPDRVDSRQGYPERQVRSFATFTMNLNL